MVFLTNQCLKKAKVVGNYILIYIYINLLIFLECVYLI